MKNNIRKETTIKAIKFTSFMMFLLIFFLASVMFIASPLVVGTLLQDYDRVSITNFSIIAAVILFGHLLNVGSVFAKNKLTKNFVVHSMAQLYKYIFQVSYDKYIEDGPSNLQIRANEAVSSYSMFYFSAVPNLIINSLMVLATVIIAFTISPLIAIIMFATLPFNYFGYKLLNKKLTTLSIEMNVICSQAWADENSVVSQVDFIKQNPTNDMLLPLIRKFRSRHQEITRKVNNYANGFSGLLTAANQIVNNILIIILAFMMIDGRIDVGNVVFIMLVLPYFTTAVTGLVNVNLSLAEIKAADTFFMEVASSIPQDGNVKIDKIDSIEVDIAEVGFEDNVLISDVTLSFKKGEVIGILGESGSGKSTLAKLLMKYRETKGIRIDGVDLTDISRESYLHLAGYYSQNVPIITDTLHNNLNFGRQPFKAEKYKNMPFLKKFNNIDMMILENGANLSAGDKQRVALGRYFTENTQLVILDEPTSSLDAETEGELLSAIFGSCEDKIVVYISHNEENMRFCTQLYKVENKHLVKIR